MAVKKIRRGRPPVDPSMKIDRTIYLRSDMEMADAVRAFRKRERITELSEAVRRLVGSALKAEGLL